MAARILEFRSLVSPAKQASFAPFSSSACGFPSGNPTLKVVTMARKGHRCRLTSKPMGIPESTGAAVARELADGFVEVEITGISLRRLMCVYRVLLGGVWTNAVAGMRTLLRPTPAL